MKGRGSTEYRKAKANWLKSKEQWGGWYVCEWCDKWTQAPELDHIKRVGSHPDLLLVESNWQLLCRECHNALATIMPGVP